MASLALTGAEAATGTNLLGHAPTGTVTGNHLPIDAFAATGAGARASIAITRFLANHRTVAITVAVAITVSSAITVAISSAIAITGPASVWAALPRRTTA